MSPPDSETPSAPETPAPAGDVDLGRLEPRDFVRSMVVDHLKSGKHGGKVVTRFPPEPNGFLHIGHAKSICLNFGLAEEAPGGVCHLRFDDTNPSTEDPRFVESIQRDIRWLGFDWGENLFFASDYFERLYGFAEQLIAKGLAYVDSSSEEEIREARGTVTEPGQESPYRDRSPAENLELFRRMRRGEFDDGAHVLRAKIDMAAANMKMRDPLLYRIRRAHHYRTGDRWCIYPLYDFAHGQSDAIEGITHSLCTLEFENNRELYDWLVDNIDIPDHPYRPRQYEFARLSLNYTVMSKRILRRLVEEGHVDGWDDPRLPTLSGLRRRGVRPQAIRAFCDGVGVAKANSVVDVAQLEHAIRDDLNAEAPRVLAVLEPLKVTLTNFPEGETERLPAPFFPPDIGKEGSRDLLLTREIWIERDDFQEEPQKGFFRLAPGREVRLRYAYVIRCDEVVKDPATGEVVELRCTYDPATRGGKVEGRKVKGTIHWVSAEHGRRARVCLYDRLFRAESPAAAADFHELLNPDSLKVLEDAVVEPAALDTVALGPASGQNLQFERQGFFYLDPEASGPGLPVFNRTVTLRDTWARVAAQAGASEPPLPKPAAPSPEASEAAASTPAERPLTPAQEERYRRYRDHHGVQDADARLLASEDYLAELFEAAQGSAADRGCQEPGQAVANWTINELQGAAGDRPLHDLPFGGEELGELVALVAGGDLSTPLGKKVLEAMVAGEGRPQEIIEARGLRPLDETALAPVVDQVLAAHASQVEEYRGGKASLLGFFIGQVMQRTRGRAEPAQVRAALAERLEKPAGNHD